MTDQTAAPYDAGDAAPAVGYRLPTGDEREQLRAEVARLRAELDRAQGVAVDGPESAVDGQAPVTGTRGMGRDASGAQNASQTVQRERTTDE